jgi:hypothetical protein
METRQAFGALFQIPQYYRKFWHCKPKMLCNYVIISNTTRGYEIAGNFRSHYTIVSTTISTSERSERVEIV